MRGGRGMAVEVRTNARDLYVFAKGTGVDLSGGTGRMCVWLKAHALKRMEWCLYYMLRRCGEEAISRRWWWIFLATR